MAWRAAPRIASPFETLRSHAYVRVKFALGGRVVVIVILAMVAGFLALRLYSVLGRRTGHEQPLVKPAEGQAVAVARARNAPELPAPPEAPSESPIDPRATDGLRALVAVDSSFDVTRFIEGAKSAYRMILEAYWRGDEEELGRLVGDEARAAFVAAIAERKAAGHVLDNRLVSIERAVIDRASVTGQIASVTVRFDADIAAVTRDGDGHVIAGSTSDAVPTHDVWTFTRHVRAEDPNWLLVETDEAA